MIRRAAPQDAHQIAETFHTSISTLTFLPPLHTEQENRRFITEVVPVDHEIWVAEDDGRVVGLAAVGERTLGHLYVHPDYQSRGLGSQLLEQVKALRPEGFTLWTFPQNDGACRFYERHGLHVSARGDGSDNEEGLPDVQYEWRPTR
jgi:ribosomal protein S18 acetylase RimI-like enzyme